MNLNRLIGGVIGFALGAAVGATVTYILREKKYQERLEHEVEKIKKSFEPANPVETPETDTPSDEKEEVVEGKGSKNEDDEDDLREYNRDDSHVEYWHGHFPKDADDSDEEDDDDYEDEYTREYERMEREQPELVKYLEIIQQYDGYEDIQIITEEQYNQNHWHYDKEHLMYYDGDKDDGIMHVANDDGEEFYGWQETLGFGDGNFDDDLFVAYEDTIFIKNDRSKCLYEVTRSMNSWFDVQTGAADW